MPGDMLLSMKVLPTVYAMRCFQLLGGSWWTHDGEDTEPLGRITVDWGNNVTADPVIIGEHLIEIGGGH